MADDRRARPGRGRAGRPLTGLADARPGLRRRRARDRWRRLRPAMVAGGVLALVIALVVVVWFTPAFSLRRVSVEGTSLLTTAEVEQRAAAPLGRPLVRVDLQQLSDRVATLPEVASVKVSQEWPSSVRIEVVERTARVQRVEGSTYQWVDASGTIFHTQTTASPKLVVVNTPSTDKRLLRDLATVSTALTPTLRAQVLGIKAQTPDAITLTLKGGRSIVWGSADESATKAKVATALLQVKATVYDVSSPANPTSR
ncbi:cell division protein FtsQ/DivIB [Aestuariimicrobium soli]|uniref:cell division protein FtsQ/DivIB n=1 Tax=Aestuariimicrobium soli TaxID=2035834 RepID=UPI003EBBDD5B